MTVELITGHAGSAHISAADDGWLNVGVVGSGKYVLNTGTQFACNVQSANLVTIGIGDALFEGRHVRVSATENVALDNGAQGVNRNDIICIKYEYNSGTSVETASLAVIKGTASSSTPADPTIPSGSILNGATAAYMPLWRIPIEGITVNTPEKLYGDVLVTLNGMLSKTWTASQIPNLSAGKITSGTLAAARVPNLDASKITSGTFAADRIPSLPASKITSGTLAAARIPDLGGTYLKRQPSSTSELPQNTSTTVFPIGLDNTFGSGKVSYMTTSNFRSAIGVGTIGTKDTLAASDIPNLAASKITSGTLAVARGGTGKTYGFAWQKLGESTGSTAVSYSLSGYSEILIGVYTSNASYMSTAVIPVPFLTSTAYEFYFGGGAYDPNGIVGRYFCADITNSKLTPVIAVKDGASVISNTHWWVYAR